MAKKERERDNPVLDISKISDRSDAFLESVNKRTGKLNMKPRVNFLTTGCLVLDLILGGGWPLGGFVEIFGAEGAGKTVLGLTAIAQAQKYGGCGLVIMSEPKLALQLQSAIPMIGLNKDKEQFMLVEPENLEDVYDTITEFVEIYKDCNEPTVIFFDSLASACPIDSDEKEVQGDHKRAKSRGIALRDYKSRAVANAAVINTGFFQRRTFKKLAKTNILFLMTNQIRANIGSLYGPKVYVPGGNAKDHATISRLDLAGRKELKIGDSKYFVDGSPAIGDPPGIFVDVYIAKNQVSAPFRGCVVPVMFSYGIDNNIASLIYIQQKGGFQYKGGRFTVNGKTYFRSHLLKAMAENPELKLLVEAEVMRLFNSSAPSSGFGEPTDILDKDKNEEVII